MEGIWSHFLGGLGPPVGDNIGGEAVAELGNDVALGGLGLKTTRYLLEQTYIHFLDMLGLPVPVEAEVGEMLKLLGGVEKAHGALWMGLVYDFLGRME